MLATFLLFVAVNAFPVDTCVKSEGLERRAPVQFVGPCLALASLIPSNKAIFPQHSTSFNFDIKPNTFPSFHYAPAPSVLIRPDVMDRALELYRNNLDNNDGFRAKVNAVNEVVREFHLDFDTVDDVKEWLDGQIMKKQFDTQDRIIQLKSLKKSGNLPPKSIKGIDAWAGLQNEMNEFTPKKNSDLYKPSLIGIAPRPARHTVLTEEDTMAEEQKAMEDEGYFYYPPGLDLFAGDPDRHQWAEASY